MQRRILQNLLRTKSSPVIDIPLDHELKLQSRTVQNVPYWLLFHNKTLYKDIALSNCSKLGREDSSKLSIWDSPIDDNKDINKILAFDDLCMMNELSLNDMVKVMEVYLVSLMD